MLLLNLSVLCYWIFLSAHQTSSTVRQQAQSISTQRSLINTFQPESQNEQKIHVLLCTDKRDKLSMYILINSILINEVYKDRLYFHILVKNKKDSIQKELAKYFGPSFKYQYDLKSIEDDNLTECIEFNDIASSIFKKSSNRLNTIMNMARFCMPHIFPSVDIGIYLDVDMIALKPLSRLIDHYYLNPKNIINNETEHKIWTVMNTDISEMKTGQQFSEQKRMKWVNKYIHSNLNPKYPSTIKYDINFANIKYMFNAGFLMFDLNEWRLNNYTEQSLDLFLLAEEYNHKFSVKPWNMVTQPIVNMLFMINGLEIGELNEEWNYLAKRHIECKNKSVTSDMIDIDHVSIFHWAGKKCKPWDGVLNDMWMKYMPSKFKEK